MAENVFKICPSCGFEWTSRDVFLEDSSLEIIGYQMNIDALDAGAFLFNHSCKSTLAIQVSAFKDIYDGPIFSARATGTDQCPEYCLHQSELRPCPVECECAYVREIIQMIKSRPKNSKRSP